MKDWDLNTAVGKIEMSLKKFRVTLAAVEAQWHDDAYRKYQEKHLSMIEPNTRNMIDAIAKLNEALAVAERDCGSEERDYR